MIRAPVEIIVSLSIISLSFFNPGMIQGILVHLSFPFISDHTLVSVWEKESQTCAKQKNYQGENSEWRMGPEEIWQGGSDM